MPDGSTTLPPQVIDQREQLLAKKVPVMKIECTLRFTMPGEIERADMVAF